jgi:copper chaperone
MMTLLPRWLPLGTALLLLLVACGGEPVATAPPDAAAVGGATTPAEDGVQIEVRVAGMHCEGCELTVEKALKAVDGVSDARADHESGLVRVWVRDPGARPAIIGAVKKAIAATEYRVVADEAAK